MNKEIIDSIRKTITIESDSIASLRDTLNINKICKLVEVLANCKGKIILAGCGTSGMAAKKIAHSLSCIEISSLFLSPADSIHGGLGVLKKDDILILISKGGNTKEIINYIPICKTKKAFLIGVSENANSILAKESDLFLEIKVEKEPCPFGLLATASTIAVMAVFDAIAIALMLKTGYTKEQFAIIHPGGAVGDKLLGKKN